MQLIRIIIKHSIIVVDCYCIYDIVTLYNAVGAGLKMSSLIVK